MSHTDQPVGDTWKLVVLKAADTYVNKDASASRDQTGAAAFLPADQGGEI